MALDGTSAPVKRPELECDIVMAGGVTSGIIYPGAVEQISRHYVFRSIGGTSVGALGAAIAAAAEYGRLTGLNPGAFKAIATIPASLGSRAPDGHSRLFHLFTPEKTTRKLYAFIMPIFSGSSWPVRIVKMMANSFRTWQIALATAVGLLVGAMGLIYSAIHPQGLPIGFSLLALLVLLLVAGTAWSTTNGVLRKVMVIVCTLVIAGLLVSAQSWSAVFAFLLAMVGLAATLGVGFLSWMAATGYVLKRFWLRDLINNKYGICTGRSDPKVEPKDGAPLLGLTNWLHAEIQAAAGRSVEDPPLTFGDLWGAPMQGRNSAIDGKTIDPREKRSIDLVMIASDISRQRTAQLPFLEMQSPLFIAEDVLDAFLPPRVATWMRCNAQKDRWPFPAEGRFIRLPRPQDLPIVFGARLSLSFPILLSAFPMKTIRLGAGNEGADVPTDVWFSDGGLTSNFPIHFFDSPIPTRPTFCLNLVDYGTGTHEIDARADMRKAGRPIATRNAGTGINAQRAVPPRGDKCWDFVGMHGDGANTDQFTDFAKNGLSSFLFTLLNTARFWSDNELLAAPGVRDRVVNIALKEDEGGLNLDMESDKIDELDIRGVAAGALIAARFDPAAETDPKTGTQGPNAFANHRWVRYRNFMAAFEQLAWRYASARQESDQKAERRQESCLKAMIDGTGKEKLDNPAPQTARAYYTQFTDELTELAQRMSAATSAPPNPAFDEASATAASGLAPRPKMRFRLRPIVNDDPRLAHADLPPMPVSPSTPGGTGGAVPTGEPPVSS